MEPLGAVLGHVYALGDPRDAGDAALLARHRTGDPAAFAALVHRHGSLVYGVCRRLLGNTPDADDAFQATFLVLLRKADGLRQPDALGPWLFGVARRTALKAKSLAAKRARREAPLTDAAARERDADLGPMLDAAVAALPAHYRAVVVACCLEGLPHTEAGRRLGCPPATVATRLARARERMRAWLGRRGYEPAGFATSVVPPAALVVRTVANPVSSSVASLAQEVGNAMAMQSWWKALTFVVVVGLAGVGAWSFGPASAEPPAAAPRDATALVPFASLRRPAPAVYTLDKNDVLGVYVEGVLGERNFVPILNAADGRGWVGVGLPVPVLEDGTIQLPLIVDLRVVGKTVTEIRDAIRDRYTKADILPKGKDRVLVTLAQPRTQRVTVVRSNTADGTAVVDLPGFDNDVLTALARGGCLPDLERRPTVTIHRRRPRFAGDDQRTVIALSRKPGEPPAFKPEDVILESGDIVVVEGGDAKPTAR